MVETKKDKVYPLVYLLVTLALVLSVSTATVERTFSVMKFVKNELRNRMGNEWMNDNLIVYIENMYLIVLIMNLLHNVFRIWNHVENNCNCVIKKFIYSSFSFYILLSFNLAPGKLFF